MESGTVYRTTTDAGACILLRIPGMLLQLMEVPASCLRCTQWAVAAVKPTIHLLQPRETLLLASVCGCGQWKMEDEEERRQQQQDEARE